MELLEPIAGFLGELSPAQIGLVVVLGLAVFYLKRAGVLFSQLGLENRRLRRGIQGYEHLEQEHLSLSQENRERNRFHESLPGLIARLNEERTLPGLSRELVDYVARALGASEVTLFLVEAGTLVLRAAHGVPAGAARIRVGEGRVGLVAHLRRTMTTEDFQNVDTQTREDLLRTVAKINTIVAAPLVTHGTLLGVLNVGGVVTSPAGIRREVVSVVAQLAATALENQINFDRLEREATTDGLTGLSNVKSFKEKLRQELSRAARYGRPVSVFLFDIDHFKNYNDKNGHPAGDQCLRLAAELVRSSSRITDLPARYGGEEFIVLLPETDAAGALTFADKIRAAVAAHDFPFRERQPLGCVSISGGVATYPDHGRDLDALVAAADQALYRAKQDGRNRVYPATTFAAAAAR